MIARPVRLLLTRREVTFAAGHRPDTLQRVTLGADAEGRLVLADLLAAACEDGPAVLLDVATLTGAARVAVGPDLPALFSRHDGLADALLAAGRDAGDPMWRLPLWTPYASFLKSGSADLCNASPKPHAGAVTAALFLSRFVPETTEWAHFDAYCWNDASAPARPEGGEVPLVRAVDLLVGRLCRTETIGESAGRSGTDGTG